jgi:hypothetical protein
MNCKVVERIKSLVPIWTDASKYKIRYLNLSYRHGILLGIK